MRVWLKVVSLKKKWLNTLELTKETMCSISATTKSPALMNGILPVGDMDSALLLQTIQVLVGI